MDRFAILIDAGYLYAAGGRVCCGTSRRDEIVIDPQRVTAHLKERCREHCDREHLRTYWYDGAPEAVPTSEQLEFGSQPGVKLRLGRLTPSGQKGVDSRIVRDLILLPRNRAVSTIYVMSGDEDVREGVAEAQEMGVSVVLLGIEPVEGSYNQAATLVREADDLIVLSRSDCEKFLQRRTVAPTGLGVKPVVASLPPEAGYEEFGRLYGEAQRQGIDADGARSVMEKQPRIPSNIDGRMLKEAARHLGDPGDEDRKDLRRGFWNGFERQVPTTDE